MYFLAVLAITIGVRSYDHGSQTVLNPVHEYETFAEVFKAGAESGGIARGLRRLWVYRSAIGTVILNILMFVPLGYLMPLASSFFRQWWIVILFGLMFSLGIETVQLITHFGWFDTADLMHNTLGAFIGYGIYRKWLREEPV